MFVSNNLPNPASTVTVKFKAKENTSYTIFIQNPNDSHATFLWSQDLNNLPNGVYTTTIDLATINPPLTNGGSYVIQVNDNTNTSCSKIDITPCPLCGSNHPAGIGDTFNNDSGGGNGTAGENPCGQPGGTCDTALGQIPSNATEFISKILGIAIGIAGGIALIFMVIGSIRVLASSGDQQKLNGGREMIIAAIAGLLFMVLSILILRFIDTNLLGRTIGFQ